MSIQNSEWQFRLTNSFRVFVSFAHTYSSPAVNALLYSRPVRLPSILFRLPFHIEEVWPLLSGVPDPSHFVTDSDADADPRIRTSEL